METRDLPTYEQLEKQFSSQHGIRPDGRVDRAHRREGHLRGQDIATDCRWCTQPIARYGDGQERHWEHSNDGRPVLLCRDVDPDGASFRKIAP